MKLSKRSIRITVFLFSAIGVCSFTQSNINGRVARVTNEDGRSTTTLCLAPSRRAFVESLTISSVAAASLLLFQRVEPADASGGATAGGAYLLSAKQRYNTRVTEGVVGFIGLRSKLESGDIDSVRIFFASEEVGSWKDFSAAGYLLANAFRRTSSAAPDSLPSVKKWKAFGAEVENIIKALKKKDTNGAIAAFDQATVALDEYLSQVDLPPSKELRK